MLHIPNIHGGLCVAGGIGDAASLSNQEKAMAIASVSATFQKPPTKTQDQERRLKLFAA
uniref:Uncharacterized protein n=1 Tax=Rhizophora mucronata TaxID=61149 RepID=A0A2P2PJQ3_RHIMU